MTVRSTSCGTRANAAECAGGLPSTAPAKTSESAARSTHASTTACGWITTPGPSVAPRRTTAVLSTIGSAEEDVGKAVVVPGGRAEKMLGRVRAADEQVQVVLPRVADAAVELDAVLRAPRRGL